MIDKRFGKTHQVFSLGFIIKKLGDSGKRIAQWKLSKFPKPKKK